MPNSTVTLKNRLSKRTFSPTVLAIRAAFAEFDVAPAEPGEVPEAQRFASHLIGGKLVAAETLAAIQETTGAALFLYREAGVLTGLFAMVLLNAEGRRAVEADQFDALDPSPLHVMTQDEDPTAIYGWGIAATNHAAAQQVIQACGAFAMTVAPHLPVYARPVTPKGVKLVVDKMMFKPVPGSTTGLVWIEPLNQRLPAVAA